MAEYMLIGCGELNCFILPGKSRSGAQNSQGKRECEIDGEKNHSLLGNLVPITVERAAWGLNFFPSLSLFSQMFSFFLSSFEISDITKGAEEGEAAWDAGQGPAIAYIRESP